MKNPAPSTEFARSFVALMDDLRTAAGDDHPAVEELIAHHDGELSEAETEGLRDHLAGCRACFELSADLESFYRAARTGPPPTADFETAVFRRTLRTRLPPRSGLSGRLGMALAASLLAAVAGLSTWTANRPAPTAEPQPNAAIYDLVPDAGERTGATRRLEIPSDVGGTLILTPDRPRECPVYQLSFLDPEDSIVLTVRGLEMRPEDETFTVWLPAGSLPLGEYRVELHGVDGEERFLLQRSRIRIVE